MFVPLRHDGLIIRYSTELITLILINNYYYSNLLHFNRLVYLFGLETKRKQRKQSFLFFFYLIIGAKFENKVPLVLRLGVFICHSP